MCVLLQVAFLHYTDTTTTANWMGCHHTLARLLATSLVMENMLGWRLLAAGCWLLLL